MLAILSTLSASANIIPQADIYWDQIITKGEVASGNLRKPGQLTFKTAVGNAKISWARRMVMPKIGWSNTLSAAYELQASATSLKDVGMAGEVAQLGSKLGYELTHAFAPKSTELKLKLSSPGVGGCILSAEYDSASPGTLKSIGVPMSYTFGTPGRWASCVLSAKTEYSPAAGAMKYAAAVKAWGARLGATASHAVGAADEEAGVAPKPLVYELTAQHIAEMSGASVSAKLSGGAKPKRLTVDLQTEEIGRSGTWLVGASVPLSHSFKEGLKDPTITLKRSFLK